MEESEDSASILNYNILKKWGSRLSLNKNLFENRVKLKFLNETSIQNSRIDQKLKLAEMFLSFSYM